MNKVFVFGYQGTLSSDHEYDYIISDNEFKKIKKKPSDKIL